MANGEGCKCNARGQFECGCEGVDWTPQELIDARADAKFYKDRDAMLWERIDALEAELFKANELISALKKESENV